MMLVYRSLLWIVADETRMEVIMALHLSTSRMVTNLSSKFTTTTPQVEICKTMDPPLRSVTADLTLIIHLREDWAKAIPPMT